MLQIKQFKKVVTSRSDVNEEAEPWKGITYKQFSALNITVEEHQGSGRAFRSPSCVLRVFTVSVFYGRAQLGFLSCTFCTASNALRKAHEVALGVALSVLLRVCFCLPALALRALSSDRPTELASSLSSQWATERRRRPADSRHAGAAASHAGVCHQRCGFTAWQPQTPGWSTMQPLVTSSTSP